MKTHTKITNVERQGLVDEKRFSMDVENPEAFRILSDSLYTDKVMAVARELSCNAYDSMKAAGKGDIPFTIHLPSTIEPFFSVQDTGLGLSHNDVMYLYTTYFRSNKNGSNDFIGGLGLGSKSPFAYTDSFTVTSVKDGIKGIYSAFMDENGIPSIAQMGSLVETSEENGVCVTLPVKPCDFNVFADKVCYILKRFPVMPNITGRTITIDRPRYTVQGNGWGVLEKIDYYQSKVVAVMGNVAYPINFSAFTELTAVQNALLNLPLEMFFEIGELKIAPSREALSMTTSTQERIRDMLDRVAAELPNHFEHMFQNEKTFWDATLIYNEIFTYGNVFYHVLRGNLLDLINFKWNGNEIRGRVSMEAGNYTVTQFHNHLKRGNSYAAHLDEKNEKYFHFVPSRNTIFIIGDTKDSMGRTQFYRSTNTDKVVYLFNSSNNEFNLDDFAPIKGAEIILASSLPKAPKTSRSTKSGETVSYWCYGEKYKSRKKWNQVSFDKNIKAYYIELERFQPVFSNEVLKYNISGAYNTDKDFDDFIRLVEKSGIVPGFSGRLYGVNKAIKSKIGNNPNWIPLTEVLEEKLKEIISSDDVQKYLNFEYLNSIRLDRNFVSIITADFDLDEDSNFQKLKKAYTYYVDSCKMLDATKVNNFTSLCMKLGYKLPTPKAPKYDIRNLMDEIATSYPMLEYVIRGNSGVSFKRQAILDYIVLVDKAHNTTR